MSKFICVCLLVIAAINDIKTKTIPVWIPIVGMLAGMALLIFSENRSELMYGGIIGLIMLFLSLAIKDFGTGDGLMILSLGLLRGVSVCVESLFIALLLATIWGLILILIKRSGEKIYLPFIPFLLLAVISVDIISEFFTELAGL